MYQVGYWWELALGIVSVYVQGLYFSKKRIKVLVCQEHHFGSGGRKSPFDRALE